MTHEHRDGTSHEQTERVDRVDRVERTTPVNSGYTPGYVAGSPQTNVNASTTGGTTVAANPVWTVTRVITLLFTVIEVLLLIRFVLKLLQANAAQPLVSAIYGITEPLVRPFQGIFPAAEGLIDLPALVAILFFFLLGLLIVALVRALSGNRAA